MSNDEKTPDKFPRKQVLPDGTVFTAYGVSKASPPIKPVSGRGASPSERRKPAKKPDWDFWLHMPEVKLWQAVALSMNIDPDSLKYHPQAWAAGPGASPIFTEDSYPSREERDTADKRLRLLVANKTVKNGFSPGTLSMSNPANHGVRLSEFAAWAIEIVKWPDLPPELVALARKQVDVPERNDATVSADNGAPVKVGAGDTATDEEDNDLARLFDPVPVTALEKMFPSEGKWAGWAEHASRHPELKAARQGRAMFNPYLAGIWFARKGHSGWDLARCRRTLANNLPDRSLDDKHRLTGELE